MTSTQDFEDHFRRLIDAGSVVGVAVGTIEGGDTSSVLLGQIEVTSGATADERTLFEIGSITKTFTALVMADMAIRQEVGLDDPVADYLPEFAGRPIGAVTLANLATHTSGLPRDPGTVDWDQGDQAHAALCSYSVDELLADAPGFDLTPGGDGNYSNLGFALLGHVLATAAAIAYPQLVLERVCLPLGMNDTVVLEPDGPPSAMAVGHDEAGDPVPPFVLAGIVPAGGLVSNLHDMLRYAEAILHPETTPLEEAIRSTTSRRVGFALDQPSERRPGVGLGWIVENREGSSVIWHNGGTHGFGSMLAVDRDRDAAVAVLANSAHDDTEELDLAAFQLLKTIGSRVP